MNNVLKNLANTILISIIIFDREGNIIFLNESAKLFFMHFSIHPLSITNFRELKDIFPQIYREIENYYTGIFSGNKNLYGTKIGEDYIADISFAPYFKNNKLENLSILIEDKTSHYKRVKAYTIQSDFLKEVLNIRDLRRSDHKKLKNKIISLIKSITKQNKILLVYGSENIFDNVFSEGFSKNDLNKFYSLRKNLNIFLKEVLTEDYNLKKDMYFIPNSVLNQFGLKLKNTNNTLICTLLKHKGKIYGLLFTEFHEKIIPYVSMIEQLSLFIEFLPLILSNYEKTTKLVEQTKFIHTVINGIPDFILVCNENFDVEVINKKAELFFNIKKNENLETKISLELFQKVKRLTKKNNSSDEIELKRGSDIYFFNIFFSTITFKNKKRFLFILQDVTENKKLQKKLIEKEKVSAVKSFFVTTNDRINNLLAIIVTKTEILEELIQKNNFNKEKVKKIVSSIKKQIDRISETISMLKNIEEVKEKQYANIPGIKQIDLPDKNKK